MVFFNHILIRYGPVFATCNLSCMKKLESLLQAEKRQCFIDVKCYPVYVMKCPQCDVPSVKQWIVDEEFTCE